MSIKLETRIINCKNDIAKNNRLLVQITKKNDRLFNSLMIMLHELPKDKADRYRTQLASADWKETEYYRRHNY